jgi:ATP-dependent Clp protease adapter protein ClpS
MGLDKKFPRRIKLLATEKPTINITMKGDTKNTTEFVSDLLGTVKEIQQEETLKN